MISVFTLIFTFYVGGSTHMKHEAMFLTKEECVKVGNSLLKIHSKYRNHSEESRALCYESLRIDGGK